MQLLITVIVHTYSISIGTWKSRKLFRHFSHESRMYTLEHGIVVVVVVVVVFTPLLGLYQL